MAASAVGSSTGTWPRNHEVDRQVPQDRIVTMPPSGAMVISTRGEEQRGQRWEEDREGMPVASGVGARD
jgi:hypothetical protein